MLKTIGVGVFPRGRDNGEVRVVHWENTRCGEIENYFEVELRVNTFKGEDLEGKVERFVGSESISKVMERAHFAIVWRSERQGGLGQIFSARPDTRGVPGPLEVTIPLVVVRETDHCEEMFE